MSKKVSFDFDSTLDRIDIQNYALSLFREGYDVWICTMRFDDNELRRRFGSMYPNEDLWEVAEDTGIPRENVIFTGQGDKWPFLKKYGPFLFHIDDDGIELKLIKKHLPETVAVQSMAPSHIWMKECQKALNGDNI